MIKYTLKTLNLSWFLKNKLSQPNLLNSGQIITNKLSKTLLTTISNDFSQDKNMGVQQKKVNSSQKKVNSPQKKADLPQKKVNSPQKKVGQRMYQKSLHKKQKHRDTFINDYVFFKSIPRDIRDDQLQRIMFMPTSQSQCQLKFSQSHNHQQGWFQNDGIKLKTYLWLPKDKKPKAVIINYHALNSHSMIIKQFAQRMTKKGYAVAAIDYPNFGKSQGDKRGNIKSFSSIAQPCQRYFYFIKSQYPGSNIYMMGTSLGGAVAFCLANKFNLKDLNGVILLSPAIRQNRFHMPVLKKIGWFLSIFFPSFRLKKTKAGGGTKLKLDDYLKTDPYIYREGMWTSTLFVMLTTMFTFTKQFKNLQNPYLIVQSGSDKLIDPFLAIDLEKYSSSKDKTTVIIHDMWHNIWFDSRRNDVIKIVEQWLQERN